MPIEGFVPLSSYDDRRDDSGAISRQTGHSAEWKMLREAIKVGEVEGYQRGGSNRWIVNKAEADRFLARTVRERRPAQEPEHDTAILASIAGMLSDIQETLREIRAAVSAEEEVAQ